MDCITPWVLDITLHTGPVVVIMTIATPITGLRSDMAVIIRIKDMADVEAGRDDGADITEATMAHAEAVGEAVAETLVEAVEEVGGAVIADWQYSRH